MHLRMHQSPRNVSPLSNWVRSADFFSGHGNGSREPPWAGHSIVVLFIKTNNYTMKRVGIVGYRGYSGAELVHILERHPNVTPLLMEHRDTPATPPAIRGTNPAPPIACTAEAVREQQLAVVFLATPPEASMELAPQMISAGARVVDLSGAFRLRTPENYSAWYKAPHTQP